MALFRHSGVEGPGLPNDWEGCMIASATSERDSAPRWWQHPFCGCFWDGEGGRVSESVHALFREVACAALHDWLSWLDSWVQNSQIMNQFNSETMQIGSWLTVLLTIPRLSLKYWTWKLVLRWLVTCDEGLNVMLSRWGDDGVTLGSVRDEMHQLLWQQHLWIKNSHQS
jgi:hypothetical protein